MPGNFKLEKETKRKLYKQFSPSPFCQEKILNSEKFSKLSNENLRNRKSCLRFDGNLVLTLKRKLLLSIVGKTEFVPEVWPSSSSGTKKYVTISFPIPWKVLNIMSNGVFVTFIVKLF